MVGSMLALEVPLLMQRSILTNTVCHVYIPANIADSIYRQTIRCDFNGNQGHTSNHEQYAVYFLITF